MKNGDDATGRRGDRPLLTIAHRAANDADTLRSALEAGVDLVEADIRLFRDVPEVRHRKTLGPRLLWEPGEIVPRRDTPVWTLADLLVTAGDECHRLILDLKGFRPGVGPAVAAVLREHAPGTPITVSTPHWWMFKSFADQPQVRAVLSAGSWPTVERLRELIRKGQDSWPNQRPIFGCAVHRTLLSRVIVAELRPHVEHVITWPVDTPAQLAEARELGVTAVTGKDLSLLETVRSP